MSPWLEHIMTAENQEYSMHYSGTLESLFDIHKYLENSFWFRWITIIFGQISYLYIASLGLISISLIESKKRLKQFFYTRENCENPLPNITLAFTSISVIGILLLGSFIFALDSDTRLDHFIYGRYVEHVLPLLISAGLLGKWTPKRIYFSLPQIVLASALVSLYFNYYDINQFNNLVNIQAFWPHALFETIKLNVLLLIGFFAVLVVGMYGKYLVITLMLPLFIICINHQADWHKDILDSYSNPSGLPDFIRHYSFGSPIRMDPEIPKTNGSRKERYNLLNYYLFNYDLQKEAAGNWLLDKDGIYLTYNPDALVDEPNVSFIAKDSTGLFVAIDSNQWDSFKKRKRQFNHENLQMSLGGDIMKLGGFNIKASDLKSFINAGKLKNGEVTTAGNSGYLIYGPYKPLIMGSYILNINGEFVNLKGAHLDIVAGKGNTTYVDTPMVLISISCQIKARLPI